MPAKSSKKTKTKKSVAAKKSTAAKKPTTAKTRMPKPVGKVTHFYDRIGVGIVKFKNPVKVGDELRFTGKKGEFTQSITSLQYNHKSITKAPKGKEVGLKVNKEVREGDLVYRA